jgi:hypothetical protein
MRVTRLRAGCSLFIPRVRDAIICQLICHLAGERDRVASKGTPVRDRAESDAKLIIARHGSHRAAVGATLFIWVNLSLLLAFGWAVLVIALDAPPVGVEVLPADWFAARLAIAVVGAGLTVLFWRSSQVPTAPMSREAITGIFQRGVLWTQGMLFLIGVSAVLGVLLLSANPAQAARLLSFGVVEVFAIQALFSGFVKTAFDILLDRKLAFLIVTGLFAAFFGLQSMAISITAADAGQNYLLALVAGGVLGAVVGAVSLALRDRSGSILPSILFHLLLFYLLIPFVD